MGFNVDPKCDNYSTFTYEGTYFCTCTVKLIFKLQQSSVFILQGQLTTSLLPFLWFIKIEKNVSQCCVVIGGEELKRIEREDLNSIEFKQKRVQNGVIYFVWCEKVLPPSYCCTKEIKTECYFEI